MKPKLKPLRDQVVVITGASSGIGLATARMAAAQGARVVVAARSGEALGQLVGEIGRAGGEATSVVADVGKEADVAEIAKVAVDAYGGIDTWINNAGLGAYGTTLEVPIEDMRRLFETNFWGVVYGSREAVRRMRGRGGAIVNLGSEVSERAVPLQGIYSASKHAIKGFTEALRMEMEDEGAAISVSLVKPGQIDTPFTVNAKNYLPSEPHHVPPVYAPEVVARTILHCATTPTREIFAGGGARMMAWLGHLAPGLTDRVMEAFVIPGTPSGRAPRRARDASGLDRPTESLEERGNYEGHARTTSLTTEAAMQPALAGLALLGVGLLARALLRRRPHRPVHFSGRRGPSSAPKGLHIRLESKPGREQEVRTLLLEILARVRREPGTRPWFGLRRSRRVFEIFETFPNESGRRAHLTGEGAALLMARSNALLARPAEISRLDLLDSKPG